MNQVETSATFDEDIDFPAKRSKERRRYRPTQQIPVVRATFELTDEEAERVAEHFGANALRSRSVVYTKGYRKGGPYVRYDYDEPKMVDHLSSQLDPTSRNAIGRHDTVEDFIEALRALDDRPSPATELLERLEAWGGSAWDCLDSAADAKLSSQLTGS